MIEIYNNEIISYLNQKYDEDFLIKKIIRRIEPAKADVVLAQCANKKYPSEIFDVIYHLSPDDIFKKEETIAALKDYGFDLDEVDFDKTESNEAPYFEDNYINIVKQHEFDDFHKTIPNVKMITKINTFNRYPLFNDIQLSLKEYFQKMGNKLMLENYIFVPSNTAFDEALFVAEMVNEFASKQFICIVYINSSIADCVDTFYKNYSFPYEAFEKDNNTVSIKTFNYNNDR